MNNSTLVPVPGESKQQLATFSTDSKKLAYVRDNNLYVLDIAEREEIQLTNDGKENNIINGAADWVYEEEFAFSQAYLWSPDGKRIAFYKFDERDVREFSMTIWGDLYPEEYAYKYPKAGEKNSTVSIHIYDLGSGSTLRVGTGDDTDIYIPRTKWTSNAGELAIQ